MASIYLFLADGFEEIEAISVIDILKRAGVAITTVSIKDSLNVLGAHKIEVLADKLFTDIDFSDCDGVILPGGGGHRKLLAYEPLKDIVVKTYNENKLVAAICAAPSILGAYGLLQNKNAVCFPGYEDKLLGANVLYDDVCVDANIVTSRSAGTAVKFSLKLVEILVSLEKSKELKETIIA